MARCILNKRRQRAWCSTVGETNTFPDIESAIDHGDDEVCLRCASAISMALRGADNPMHIETIEEIFLGAVRLADPVVADHPTLDCVVSVAASLMQAAASTWQRFQMSENDRRYFPLDEERFSRLAALMFYHWERQQKRPHQN